MAGQAAAFQQALVAHERIRKSTDLPLFHGDRSKDTIEPQDFLNRFETASQIANWVPAPAAGQPPNEARKCQELFMLLRHTAAEWWKALELLPNFDMNVWDNIRTQFLITFAPRYTARTACLSFTDLVQQPGEGVSTFFLRVTKAYRLLKETRPAEMLDVNLPLCELDVDLAPRIAAANAHCRLVKEEGIEDMGRYVIQAMFTAGLHEELRIKTMEARLDSHSAAYQYALNLECIIKDKRGSKPLVTAVQQAEDEAGIDEDDEDEDLLEQINAIRFSRGKKPVRFASKGNFGKITVSCRYCKKTGHFQKDCLKRKREKGAMVDAQGKPYKVTSLEEPEEEHQSEEEEPSNVNSIAQSFYGINAIREEFTPNPMNGLLNSIREIDDDSEPDMFEAINNRWGHAPYTPSTSSEDSDGWRRIPYTPSTSSEDSEGEERYIQLGIFPVSPTDREFACDCFRHRHLIRKRPTWFTEETVQEFLSKHEMTDIDDDNLKCTCEEDRNRSHRDEWPEEEEPDIMPQPERDMLNHSHRENWMEEVGEGSNYYENESDASSIINM
jgi:hypothetical protein